MNQLESHNLKDKYVRSIIKLGNSKAITFPQDWANIAGLSEKSEVSLYPIDTKTIVIRARDKEENKTVFRIDGNKWSLDLIRQGLIAAFKLNVDEIFITYDSNKSVQEKLYELLTELRKEIIGIDFKNLSDKFEFYIYFLLDSKKTNFQEVLIDLINVFSVIIRDIIDGISKNNNRLLLDEMERKYSLGRRILITGLSEYPISKGYHNLPIIQFLGNRILLLGVRDFINESLNLQSFPKKIIQKYSELLRRIPSLLTDIVTNFDNISLNTISEFHDQLNNLNSTLKNIKEGDSFEDLEIRNIIRYYLNSFQNFFDIGMTRLVESEIGMV